MRDPHHGRTPFRAGEVLGEDGQGSAWIRRREAFYVRALGPMREPAVYHWEDDGDPHVDVYVIGRSPARPHETLITGGLADRPQPGVPVGAGRARRVELLLPMPRAEDWAAMILREIASLPFAFGFPLARGGMIRGSRAIAEGSSLAHALLVPAREETGLAGFLVEGEEVTFLRPVFLTEAEFELGRRQGTDRLVATLEAGGVGPVLDPLRASVA